MSSEEDHRRPTHWLVLGVLHDDNTFVRNPGFTGEVARATLDAESPLRAELLDADGRMLLRAGIPLLRPCADGPGPEPSFRVAAATVPLPARTSQVHFLLDDVLLEEYRVPDGEPRTTLTAVPERGARGRARVAWESEHPEGVPLTHAVGFSADDGQTWQPVGVPTRENGVELDLDALPGGKACRISVKTTDGVHTITTTSDPIALLVKPCMAMILAPGTGHELGAGATLRLQGQGYWLEERRPEFDALFWSSSRAGALGEGALVEVSGLQPGRHEITLTAGEGERAGRASIEIAIA
jgi:hypothetical protein